MSDIYTLDTPESVAVGYPVAGVGSRFLAALFDTVILVVVLFALAIITHVAGTTVGGTGSYVANAIGLLTINIVFWGYYMFFETVWNGQSPGKRMMRIRVIGTNGYPVTFVAVLIRNVLRLVDFLPALYAVGVLTMIANRRARRLGDLAAGTMVIKEDRDVSLASLPAVPAQPVAGTGPSLPFATQSEPVPMVRLSREDEALIRDFLNRRTDLPAARRYALASQLAAIVHQHVGGDPPQAPETYLEGVLATHVRATYGR